MAVQNSDLVVKSNKLVEAGYRLDLIEQRIILAAIVEARETQQGLGDGHITLEAKKFAEVFGMSGGAVYDQLKEAMNTLFTRFVVIRDIHPESGKERVSKVRWISSASYIDGAGTVQLRFTPEMVPYITRLESEFTSYRLEKIGHMTSAHAIRLYELLIQYLSVGSREMELAWLKDALELGGEYPRLFDLKRWVVDVALKQINKHSDITASYTQRKTGRAVTHLVFDIKAKAEAAAKPARKKRVPMDRDYIEKNALPGESYEQAERRLRAKKT